MAQKPFYVVLRRSDDRLYRHTCIGSATEEAKRLAQGFHDAFFVLPVLDGYKFSSLQSKQIKLDESLARKLIRSLIKSLYQLLECL